MDPPELAWLFNRAKRLGFPEAVWVEVGSFKGRSLLATGLGLPAKATLIAVDDFSGQPPDHYGMAWEFSLKTWLRNHLNLIIDFLHRARPFLKVRHLEMSSFESSRLFSAYSVDVVFLDGDRTYEGSEEDIRVWRPKIKPQNDCSLCGHDFQELWPGVMKAVREHVPGYQVDVGTIWHASGDAVFRKSSEAIVQSVKRESQVADWICTRDELLELLISGFPNLENDNVYATVLSLVPYDIRFDAIAALPEPRRERIVELLKRHGISTSGAVYQE